MHNKSELQSFLSQFNDVFAPDSDKERLLSLFQRSQTYGIWLTYFGLSDFGFIEDDEWQTIHGVVCLLVVTAFAPK